MKTIVYVEESENALADALIKRKDIQLRLLRFTNCRSFSQKHLAETVHIPCFEIDKKQPIAKTCEEVRAFLQETCSRVDVFYNDSDINKIYIQEIARELGLKGALTERQARLVRDKVGMKDFIRQIGLSCPDYLPLSSQEDIRICVEKWGYPFIVKWRTGVSSIEVYKVTSRENLDELGLNFAENRYMAEEYLPHKIWCLDALVAKGSVVQNLYTWLPYPNLDFAKEKRRFCQLAVGSPQEYWKFDAQAMTQRIVTALGVDNGYLHLEAFVSEDGVAKICEFAWRTPGDHMLQNFSHLYGRSVEDCLIDILLELPFSGLPESDCCTADVFLPVRTGTIRNISTLDSLKHSCDILDGEIWYHPGDGLSNRQSYTDSAGWVQVSAVGIDSVLEKVNTVYQNFVLEMEEDL